MKQLIVIASAIFLTLLVADTQGYSQEQTQPKHKASSVRSSKVKSIYTCPMHPEVTSRKPGKCSKCGMNLVKKQSEPVQEKPKTEQASYTCPMHSDVRSDKPGDCPKCGMNLVKKESESVQEKPKTEEASYGCPMHPNVRSDKPGDCPECGMKLHKIKSSK